MIAIYIADEALQGGFHVIGTVPRQRRLRLSLLATSAPTHAQNFSHVVSKIEAERTAWSFVEEQKPPFRVNLSNPPINCGKVLPDAELPPADSDEPLDIIALDDEPGTELLRTWWVQKG
jgi:hypothetical protein